MIGSLRRVVLTIVALVAAVGAYAAVAGSIVVTSAVLDSSTIRVSIAWTANASGAVTENLTPNISGRLFQAKFAPGTGGDAPDAGYDVTLLDGDGVDVLIGGGANLGAATSTIVQILPPVYLDAQALQPVVANAGSTNKGTLVLWVQR